MKTARQLVYEAMNLGDSPDFIDPEKRRKIESGEHPYAKNQAMPQELVDLMASEAYTDLIRKLQRYTGVRPRPNDRYRLIHMMQDAMHQVMRIEHGHERRLEQAAVELVLSMPKFAAAKQAVEAGDLRIVAQLTPQGADIRGAQVEPDAPDEAAQAELQIAQVAQELDLEVEKRKFVNLLSQGAAMHANYELDQAEQLLNGISPRLMNLYGTLMSLGELQYWAMSEEAQEAMNAMGAEAGMAHGSERIEQGEDGIPTIYAQGILFPVLVQEITKGLMEYLSHTDEDDPDTRRHAINHADTLKNETWDIKLGPAVWKRFATALGEQNEDLIPHIYDHLLHLPTGEFNRIMQGILRNDPQVRRHLQQLAQQARAEQQQQQQQGGATEAGQEPESEPEGGEEDKADWWKESAEEIVKRLTDEPES